MRKKQGTSRRVPGKGKGGPTRSSVGRKRRKVVEEREANIFPSLHEIAWDLYTRYYSVSPSSQLTLPPLHSSVLTLLGQKSPVKPSPRQNGLSQGSSTAPSSKHKVNGQVQ
jgi:hypothetical protein